MNRKCAVVNCESRYRGTTNKLHFFKFPSDVSLQKEWVKFCGQRKKINTKSSKICMVHFQPEDFENSIQYEMGIAERIRLTRGAVPSIKTISKANIKLHNERMARINRREGKKIVASLLKEYSIDSTSNQSDNLYDNEVDLLGEIKSHDVELHTEQAPPMNMRKQNTVDECIEDDLDDSEDYLLEETSSLDFQLHKKQSPGRNIQEQDTVDESIENDELDDFEAYLLEATDASIIELHKERGLRSDMREHRTVGISDYEAYSLEETDSPYTDIRKKRARIGMRKQKTVGSSIQLDEIDETEVPIFERHFFVKEEENENKTLSEKCSCDENLQAELEKLKKENRALRKNATKHELEMRAFEEKMNRIERDMECLQKQMEESNLELAHLKEKLQRNN